MNSSPAEGILPAASWTVSRPHFCLLDTESRYNFVSSKLRKSSGYEPTEVLASPAAERTPLMTARRVALFDDLVAGKENFASIEIRVEQAGRMRRLTCNFSPLFDRHEKSTAPSSPAGDRHECERSLETPFPGRKNCGHGPDACGVWPELNNPLTAISAPANFSATRQGGRR